ncbi:unnamed protein product [Hydatigera taeniaeformis]|uniref:Uncharacterized protein n=1 Tax=Hydatigena taeniaeformis TaxID=6205 RepID=A0A0R3X831_HYDTA|nr:unnamed protein product [Hydatigera taeniaeformis]
MSVFLKPFHALKNLYPEERRSLFLLSEFFLFLRRLKDLNKVRLPNSIFGLDQAPAGPHFIPLIIFTGYLLLPLPLHP